jgi:hypothetical protein
VQLGSAVLSVLAVVVAPVAAVLAPVLGCLLRCVLVLSVGAYYWLELLGDAALPILSAVVAPVVSPILAYLKAHLFKTVSYASLHQLIACTLLLVLLAVC